MIDKKIATEAKRAGKISLAPLTFSEAVSGLLAVKPKKKAKANPVKKKKPAKKASKKAKP